MAEVGEPASIYERDPNDVYGLAPDGKPITYGDLTELLNKTAGLGAREVDAGFVRTGIKSQPSQGQEQVNG